MPLGRVITFARLPNSAPTYPRRGLSSQRIPNPVTPTSYTAVAGRLSLISRTDRIGCRGSNLLGCNFARLLSQDGASGLLINIGMQADRIEQTAPLAAPAALPARLKEALVKTLPQGTAFELQLPGQPVWRLGEGTTKFRI